MLKTTVEIKNRLGLHARPAMKLFELMQSFDADIWLRSDDGKEAEGSSIMAMIMLASAQGQTIEVQANGPQAAEALHAVVELINAGFDEE
ncbi:MAG: PTS phosphocarrier protein NPr [Plesiomonas sp.]|uniref:PTS phosphocarrier protein NPr n=1 Tax=Plesiomonas sp. TaxID=2486279 RepID=UPI003EE465B8